MNTPKFTVSSFSFEPLVKTDATPSLAHSKVMPDATRHLRRESAAGHTPTLAAHAGVLQRDPALAGAALELASAHYAALAGGTQAPTATAIFDQTPEFAKSLGMNDTPQAPKQGLSLGKKRGLGMGK